MCTFTLPVTHGTVHYSPSAADLDWVGRGPLHVGARAENTQIQTSAPG